MTELVDVLDLESSVAKRVGSNPTGATKIRIKDKKYMGSFIE